MQAVLVGTVPAIRLHVVDVGDSAFVVDRDRCDVLEVSVHHGAGAFRECVIQEFIEQHPAEEDGMTALTIKSGDDKRCLAALKHVDEILHSVLVNQGIVDGAETHSLHRIIEDPD